MRFLYILMLLLTFLDPVLSQEKAFAPTGAYFYDGPRLLSFGFEKKLAFSLKNYHKKKQIFLGLIYLESLQGEDIESFSQRLLQSYQTEIKTPVSLLIISLSDRKIRIEQDHQSQRIWPLRSKENIITTLKPFLARASYEETSLLALNLMANAYSTELEELPLFKKRRDYRKYDWSLFVIICFLTLFFGRGRRKTSSLCLYPEDLKHDRFYTRYKARW